MFTTVRTRNWLRINLFFRPKKKIEWEEHDKYRQHSKGPEKRCFAFPLFGITINPDSGYDGCYISYPFQNGMPPVFDFVLIILQPVRVFVNKRNEFALCFARTYLCILCNREAKGRPTYMRCEITQVLSVPDV